MTKQLIGRARHRKEEVKENIPDNSGELEGLVNIKTKELQFKCGASSRRMKIVTNDSISEKNESEESEQIEPIIQYSKSKKGSIKNSSIETIGKPSVHDNDYLNPSKQVSILLQNESKFEYGGNATVLSINQNYNESDYNHYLENTEIQNPMLSMQGSDRKSVV